MQNSSADLKPSLIDLEASNMATGGKQEHNSSMQPERLSERDNVYCIYWIHLTEHNNKYTEGYIGITSNFKRRMQAHSELKRKNNHFKNAIRKYGWDNLEKEILKSNITLDEALKLEELYRPSQNIGWNSQQGGKLGVEKGWYSIDKNKERHRKRTSEATKKAIELKDTHEARSKRAKLSNAIHKDKYRKALRGSNNPKAKLNENQVYKIKFELIPNGLDNFKIAEMFNVKSYVIQFIRVNKTWKHVVCDSPDHK